MKRGSPAEAEELPSVRRPKLHHACGLAYKSEEKKEKGDVALLYVQRFHFSGDSSFKFLLCYGQCVEHVV